MRFIKNIVFIFPVLFLLSCKQNSFQDLSPMGFGWKTSGGLNGDTLYVTNLNDKGPGSFRHLVNKDTSRVIEFLVAGIIRLESPIKISKGK